MCSNLCLRCTLGATSGDEMCNLYLMYYTTSKDTDFIVCFDEEDSQLNQHLPEGCSFFLSKIHAIKANN